MNLPSSLLTSIVDESYAQPSFVDKTYGEPLFHTESEIRAVCYAADQTLWTIEEAGILRHWASDGRLLDRDYLSDTEDMWAFNADGSLLISTTDEVALWSTAKAKQLKRADVGEWGSALAFAPNGQLVATGHDDGRICFWKLPSLELLHTLDAHTDNVSALVFSGDSQQLTSAGDDHLIRVWDVATYAQIKEWKGHTDRVPAMAWHPKGEYLITAGWDTTARVWEAGKAEPSILLNAHSDQVNVIAFSPDGGLLACADSDFAIHVWSDPRQAKAKFILRGHTDEIRTLSFSADGTRLASAGADRVVHIWDMTTGKLVAGPNPNARHSIAISGAVLFSTAGSLLQGWNPESGQRAWPHTNGEVHFVAASPDGQRLVTTNQTPTITVWNTATQQVETTLTHTRGPINSPVFSHDSTLLATASMSDGLVWVWKMGEAEAVLVIPEAADGSTLETIAFHPNGKYLAVGGLDWLATSGHAGALCIWDMETRDKHLTLTTGVTSVAFDHDGRYLAAGTFSDGVQVLVVWDFEKQEKVFELPGHHDRINAVAFSPDGSWLVSASDDCTVRVWNVLTGRLVVARQFDAAVQSLAFSADGNYLFTGNANTTCFRLEMKKLLED